MSDNKDASMALTAAQFEEKFSQLLKKYPPEVVKGAMQDLIHALHENQTVEGVLEYQRPEQRD